MNGQFDSDAELGSDAELDDVSEADKDEEADKDDVSEADKEDETSDEDEDDEEEHMLFQCPDGVSMHETMPAWVDDVAHMKKTRIAHYFTTGWEIGQIKGKEGKSSSDHFGEFYVKYKTETEYLYHELNEDQYGASKLWVLLK